MLDLGCGTGQLTLPLARHVAAAVGMDPEPEMLAEAAGQAEANGVTNVTWTQGSSADLPANLRRFRLVTMGRSFHWMDREQVLAVLDGMVDDEGGVVLANDSCLVRPATAWQRAIQELQPRFVPSDFAIPDPLPGRMQAAVDDRSHEEILARSPFPNVHHGSTNPHVHGQSNRSSATSTPRRCPFAGYSATGAARSNKRSPTHCSR